MIGSIYRIIHLHSNICYVGSTLDSVRNRWQGHKSAYSTYLRSEKDISISIYPYFKQYGIDSFKCILVKEYEVEDRNHLFAYEQLWINKFKPINTNSAFNPLSENKLFQSYRAKQYHLDNKDKIKEKDKQYHLDNKDKIKEKDKQRYKTNKDKIRQCQKEYEKTDIYKQRKKLYREANKDKLKQYREENKDKILQAKKQYREVNKDKIRQQQKEYRERKKQLKSELEYEV